MDRRDLVRGAALLCCHFTRNACYYRAGWLDKSRVFPSTDLWKTVNNNFLDIAVLEWCKLFADRRGEHHYLKAVKSPAEFQAMLLSELACSNEVWSVYIDNHRRYRDKFIAHLDEGRTMEIPELSLAISSVACLYATLCAEDQDSHLQELAGDLRGESEVWTAEARWLYELADGKPHSTGILTPRGA